MGSSCTCNCARTNPETAVEEESQPSSAPKGPAGGALEEVKVPPGTTGAAVPLVAKFRVLQQSWRDGGSTQRATPRFEEAATPLLGGASAEPPCTPSKPSSGGAGCDTARSFGWTPRDSPRPSPRDNEDDSAEVSYDGAYLDSKKHGFGTLRMNACTYIGDFWHDAKQGAATLTWDDGREYCGQFRQGMFHGCATMTWPDGRRYTGQYAENQKHGEGIFTWKDGRRYEGQWVIGKRHGVGTYTNAKGFSRRGYWERDRPVRWHSAAADELDGAAAEQVAAAAVAAAVAAASARDVGSGASGPAQAAESREVDITTNL